MTYKKFTELLSRKYPEAEACSHGSFGGTERNGKVALTFKKGGKVYEYYGAYEDILCRLGIKTISRARLNSIEGALRSYERWHGQKGLFGETADYSAQVERLRAQLKEIEENYIVV